MKRKEYKAPVFIGQNLYVKPSYIVSIPEFYREGGNSRSLAFIENQKNLENNQAGGKLSRKAVTGLRNAINWLCLSAKKKKVFVKAKNSHFFFKVNFVTLTLPDTDQDISPADLQKKLLNPFLTLFRKEYGLKNYVWRIEYQKNGKLHVHLTCDTFLHYQIVRDSWNRLLDKNGYLDKFFRDHRHKDPNSTDIHATRKVKNLAAYLAKYMSKPEKVEGMTEFKGRLWGCSRELSRANKLTVHIPADQCATELRCLMDTGIEYKDITVKPPETIHAMFNPGLNEPRKIGEIYFLTAMDWFSKMKGVIRESFDNMRYLLSNAGNQANVFELV